MIEPDAKWHELPKGGVIPEGGTAALYETGDWRSRRPVHDKAKCTNCLICWIYCPDSAIIVEDGKVAGIDYAHCKGCGICARECPPKIRAIEMKDESEFE